jgi:LemA protein
MPWWIYLLAALVLIGLLLLGTYNSVVKRKNQADESWSGVDVQLKRRRDLVPNLVTSVAAYAGHEADVLRLVTERRVAADSAAHAGASQAVAAENHLTGALRGLFVVVERYPELKASENFMQLQGQLVAVENNVAAARAIYNSNARRYNDRIQSIPAVLFIGAFGFRALPYVEAAAAERGVGRVDFA